MDESKKYQEKHDQKMNNLWQPMISYNWFQLIILANYEYKFYHENNSHNLQKKMLIIITLLDKKIGYKNNNNTAGQKNRIQEQK